VLEDEFGDVALGIVEVAEHPDPCHARRHAGGLFSFFNEFDTESALLDIAFLPDDPDVVRAGGNAILAADAFVLVHEDNAVFSFVRRSGGTNLDTGRVVTVLALHGKKFTGVIGKCPVFPFLKIVVGLLLSEAILIVARHTTGMAPDTLRFVNHHSVSRHHLPHFSFQIVDLRFDLHLVGYALCAMPFAA
jgi:hypothetical protein